MLTVSELIAFEAEIAEAFNAARICAPVHLSGGNEVQLIAYFAEHFNPGDWVFSTWRSHYHALLAGIPPSSVRAAIMDGRSISLCFPEHRFFSSAIVGGCLPIALGVALGMKRARDKNRVHCFVGDMAAYTGAFHECSSYAFGHGLPLNVIVESNGISVCTPTEAAWGHQKADDFASYDYHLSWPHAGAGKRVEF